MVVQWAAGKSGPMQSKPLLQEVPWPPGWCPGSYCIATSSISLCGIIILFPEHSITDYLLGLFSFSFYYFSDEPLWTKHKACRMNRRNPSSSSPPSCLQISNKCQIFLLWEVVEGFFYATRSLIHLHRKFTINLWLMNWHFSGVTRLL